MYWNYKKLTVINYTAALHWLMKTVRISVLGAFKIKPANKCIIYSIVKNDDLLKNTSLQNFEAILQKGTNTRQLRPTLYDLLAHRALNYYMDEKTM